MSNGDWCGVTLEDARAHAYAQKRANETGQPYLVSDVGHVMLDCPDNRLVLEQIRCKVIAVYPKEK